MVGDDQVVINGFRHADNTHVVPVRFGIYRKFCHGVHRVVAADIKEIADIVFLKDRENLLIHRVILPRGGEFFATGAERRRRGVLQQLQFGAVGKDLVQIRQSLCGKPLDSVAHSVQFTDGALSVFQHAAYHAGKRGIDRGGRSAGLPHYRISDQLIHSALQSSAMDIL